MCSDLDFLTIIYINMKNGRFIEDDPERWYLNGELKLHRMDGPAIINSDGRQEWWVNGKEVKKDIFNLILTCTMEDLIPYIFYPQYKDYKPLVEDRLRRNKE